MRRHKHSRRTETESSSNSESSENHRHDSAHQTKKVKYIRVEVPRRDAAKGSDSSDSGRAPPRRKPKQVVVRVSKATRVTNSDRSDRSSTFEPKKVKNVVLRFPETKAAQRSDRDDRSSYVPTRTAAGVSKTRAAKDSDSTERSVTPPPKKTKDVGPGVAKPKAATGSESSDRSPTPPPRKSKQVVAGVSKAKTAKGSDGTDRSACPSPKKTKDVGLGVSKTKAAKGSYRSDRSPTPPPRTAKQVSAVVSKIEAVKCPDITHLTSSPPPRKANFDNIGTSGLRAAMGSNCSDRSSILPPDNSKDESAEVNAREADKIRYNSSKDSASPQRDATDVSAKVPGCRVVAPSGKIASLYVSTPIVQITVDKPPPSLWSRVWSGLMRVKSSQGEGHDGALEDEKAPAADSRAHLVASQESPLPEDKRTEDDSSALLQESEPSSSSASIIVQSASSEAGTGEPSPKKRKIVTIDSKTRLELDYLSDEPDRTASLIDAEEASHRGPELYTYQNENKSVAVTRLAINSYRQFKCRSHVVTKRLREATNDIGLSIFCAYPGDQNLCLSVYGLSFMIGLTKHCADDSKAVLKETLKFGAIVPKDDGLMLQCCKEVVTRLTRRLAETDEVFVITEAYLRPSATGKQEEGYSFASSTKNVTSHLLTAELDTSILRPAQGSWNDVLFNTACFDNFTRCPFNNQSTYIGSFLNNWTEKVAVPTMRRTSFLPYSYDTDRQVDIVCFPYADNEVWMTLIVQRSPSSETLSELTPADVWSFVHGARSTLVTLHLPKFRISTTVDVHDLMNEIACATLQDRWTMFLHAKLQTRIVLNELNWPVTCTECPSSAAEPVTVVVDRPFHFVITDRTSDLILYVGRLMSLT